MVSAERVGPHFSGRSLWTLQRRQLPIMSLRHLTPSPRLLSLTSSPSSFLACTSSRAFASSSAKRTQPSARPGPTLRAGPSLSNPPPPGSTDTSGDGFGAKDHAGPFPLGPRDLDQRLYLGQRPSRPKWKELTTKGKRESRASGNSWRKLDDGTVS